MSAASLSHFSISAKHFKQQISLQMKLSHFFMFKLHFPIFGWGNQFLRAFHASNDLTNFCLIFPVELGLREYHKDCSNISALFWFPLDKICRYVWPSEWCWKYYRRSVNWSRSRSYHRLVINKTKATSTTKMKR